MGETLSTSVPNQSSMVHTSTFWVSKLLLVALICVLLTWYLQSLWRNRRLYKYSSKVPGPLALPLVGCIHLFLGRPENVLSKITKIYNDYPGICRLWMGSNLLYLISDPKYHYILLSKCLEKAYFYQYIERAVGPGLVTAPQKMWKRHRKIINPTFNQKVLDGYVEIFSQQSEILVEQLKKFVGKGEFDILDKVSKCTVDIICETAMGVKVYNQTTNDVPVSKWIDGIMENSFLEVMFFWYSVDSVFHVAAKEFRTAHKNFHNFCSSVIKEKQRQFKKAREQSETVHENWGKDTKGKIFLNHLLEITSDGGQLTEEELINEVNTIIITGSDTTTSTSCFVLLTLGLYRDLQEKVYEEIMEMVGPDRAVEVDDLPKLQYLDRFIKETLRLFPVTGVIGRLVEEDVNLGDYVVPAGATVAFGLINTHMDEKYWPDPYRFDPDRFLPEEVAKRHPCAFISFSYGPRNCIGTKFGMMAMKTLIATVVRKFKVNTSYKNLQDVKLMGNPIVRPIDGYKLSVELR